MDSVQGEVSSSRLRRQKWTNRGLKVIAADEIRDRIFTGELAPGCKVDQDAISRSTWV